jgi:hypothetical protein
VQILRGDYWTYLHSKVQALLAHLCDCSMSTGPLPIGTSAYLLDLPRYQGRLKRNALSSAPRRTLLGSLGVPPSAMEGAAEGLGSPALFRDGSACDLERQRDRSVFGNAALPAYPDFGEAWVHLSCA